MLLSLLLSAAPAWAGLVVTGEASGGGSPGVPLDRTVGAGRPEAARATMFYDAAGWRWEVTLDVDDLGDNALIAVVLRVHDARGRPVGTFNPTLLARMGEEASVSVQDVRPGALNYAVRVRVEREGDAADGADAPGPDSKATEANATEAKGAVAEGAVAEGAVAEGAVAESAVANVGAIVPTLRRTFFATRGRSAYTFFVHQPTWTGLACEGTDLHVVGGEGAQHVALEGRYRPGDRVETRCSVTTTAPGAPEGTQASIPVSIAFL
ncbi:MAG: hypothetical protein Q8P41_28160 [Pseudomonadota bacterium]|nr:hypothetical protein [Pseudomonadota bacterium]